MDPRIDVALVALGILEKLHRSGKLKGDLKPLKSLLMSLKWVDDVEYLRANVGNISEALEGLRCLKDCELFEWCVNYLKTLHERLGRPGGSVLSALDCGTGKVVSVHRIDEKLSICRVDSKYGSLTVVTNLSVKKGDTLPFVILPPRKFGDAVSEAMFVWGPVRDLGEVDWKKVKGEVSGVLDQLRFKNGKG